MKLLAWNLNHRAMRRRIADWIGSAIIERSPDIVVLTEYVEGDDHAKFVGALSAGCLEHVLVSPRTMGQNQVLMASRLPVELGTLRAPAIHASVPPNALEAVVVPLGLHVVGFRMPAFEGVDRPMKRKTWDWLLAELKRLRDRPAVLAGDFNTALNDSTSRCGDCFLLLAKQGWHCCTPDSGCSWRHPKSGTERKIDHVFVSPALTRRRSEYCWEFQQHLPQPVPKSAGVPDHAMLLAEFEM